MPVHFRSCHNGASHTVTTELEARTLQTDGESALHRTQIPADQLIFCASAEQIITVGTENRVDGLSFVSAKHTPFAGFGISQMNVTQTIGHGDPPPARMPGKCSHHGIESQG
jgi:hypothetical protein